jgi:diguanylate cyclase (GGDEF)-like protein
MRPLRSLDERLERLARAHVVALAVCGVFVVGVADYLTGYEISISLLYLGPVAVAAWYATRWAGIAIAFLSCVAWYIADLAAGNQYSHPAIPVWNTFVRFGLFLSSALLLNALRQSLRYQQHLARTDGLTGLYNRRAFEDRFEHDLLLAQRRKSTLTVVYVDVDDFKAVNDTLGHAGGDRVLLEIGRVLKTSVRETDSAARIGGDEFALVFPDTDAAAAHQVISKLTHELREALGTNGLRVTCSIGVVTLLGSATSREQAVAAADKVMYQVKRKGKGAVEFSVLG